MLAYFVLLRLSTFPSLNLNELRNYMLFDKASADVKFKYLSHIRLPYLQGLHKYPYTGSSPTPFKTKSTLWNPIRFPTTLL